MTLHDEIIDEAEKLAEIVPQLSCDEIADAVGDIVGVKIAYNSIGARLAEAAYNRIYFANQAIQTAVLS